jgi:hypothetical protein
MRKSGKFLISLFLFVGLISNVNAQYQLTGSVNYNNDESLPIPQVTLGLYDFQDVLVVSTITDDEGHYLFEEIPAGEYVLKSSTFYEPDLVDMKDAYLILMYLSNRIELDEIQFEAADIDNSGTVTWYDYSFIVTNYLLRGEAFPAGIWQFEEAYIDFSSRAEPDTTDLWGITEGDVEGIWEPSGRGLNIPSFSHYTVQQKSNEFQFDINTNFNSQISGFTMNLSYPADQIKITNVEGPDENINYVIDTEKGIVKIIWLDENITGQINGNKLITLTAETQSDNFESAAIELLQGSMLLDAKGNEIKDIEIQLPLLEKSKDIEISVSTYPNPVVNQLHININDKEAKYASIAIYNASGKLISKTNVVLSGNGAEQTSVNTQNIKPGNYFYLIELSGAKKYVASGQFIKSN